MQETDDVGLDQGGGTGSIEKWLDLFYSKHTFSLHTLTYLKSECMLYWGSILGLLATGGSHDVVVQLAKNFPMVPCGNCQH